MLNVNESIKSKFISHRKKTYKAKTCKLAFDVFEKKKKKITKQKKTPYF